MVGQRYSAYEEQFLMESSYAPGGIVIYYADGDKEIVHVNQYVVDLFECDSVDDFLDYVGGSFRNCVCEDDIDAIENSIWGQVENRNGFDHVFYRIRTKTGRLVVVSDFGRLTHDELHDRPLFQVFVSKVSSTSTMDWLTSLPSMMRFHELARMGTAKMFDNGERPVAIAFDIMGMKSFNTRFGRDEGDRLLCAFADVLRGQFGNEACSRFAEDHFYAFSVEDGIEQRIERIFDDYHNADFERVPPLRVGIYALDAGDDIVAVGFDRAKLACDLDRKTWKSHYEWFTDEMRTAARLRSHVINNLDQAIAEGWIRPYYQAIVRATTGDICNEEALARWDDPEFGMLMPNQFIPDLEDAGLLHKLDMHIVDCVIEDMLTKRKQGVSVVPVSMNFSLRDLLQLDLTQEIAARADAAGIPRGLLRIELTESVASSNPDSLREQLEAMHAAGFEVWMDDFGSGYSSLNTLQEFDFDLIKLDMGFLRGTQGPKQRVILAGVVQAAGKLGVGTLAEGVECAEQAAFLESIGCDMLQGYFCAMPHDLQSIIGHSHGPNDYHREPYAEKAYWSSVSLLSLTDLAESDEKAVDWAPVTEYPACVIECRSGTWRILRSNRPCREFLDSVGVLSLEASDLVANPAECDMDKKFCDAAERSRESGTWEHVGGPWEYGSGYQFYTRSAVSTAGADSFMLVGVPTMLGSSLGAYGDVPVAYAVLRLIFNEDRSEAVDGEYVYANDMYCEMSGVDPNEIVGKRYLKTVTNGSPMWLPYCYRALKENRRVHDMAYGPEFGHWLSFYVAPTPMEDCFVFACALADDERREHEEILKGLDTSALIIEIADTFNGELSYEVAMDHLLESVSRVIHPERLYIYERNEKTTTNTFEWCAPGVTPQIHMLHDIDNAEFELWDELLTQDTVVVIDDVEKLKGVSERMYEKLTRRGIQRTLAIPFYSDSELIGYLGADNYVLDKSLDTRRLLETVSSFVSARIVSQRLLTRVRRLGTHDELTDMLSRRGVDLAIAERLSEHPDEPFALALMDIDDFKIMNDVNGHDVGDKALGLLSDIVKDAFPSHAILGRNGGDEFVAMLQGPDVARIDDILWQIVTADTGFEHEGQHFRTSLSIGYALCPLQAENLRMAYSMANAALYTVKLSGKSGFRRYSHLMKSQYRMQTGFTPRDLAENVPGGVVVHLPGDGKILFANDELIDIFGCQNLSDFMRLTGGTFAGLMHPDDRDRVRQELDAQMTLDDVGHKDFVNYRIVTKQGTVKNVENNGRLVELDSVGKVFYELIVDINERNERNDRFA